jgi:small subunit ribosomal protein S1
VAGQLRERQIVTGKIVRATDFGLFVELLPGVDGLLHMSEIPRSQQGQLKEAAAGGAEIAIMVLGIDPGKKRISLALAPEGATAGEEVKGAEVGAVITGTVERVEPFGVFVRIGPGQIGLIPNAEMGTPRNTDHRKDFGPGTEMKVVVAAIEEGGKRIRLSRSKVLAQEEQAETQAYIKGSQKGGGFGMTLGDLLKQKHKG